LWAKVDGKTLWKLLADMSPGELVRCVDLRSIIYTIPPAEAIALIEQSIAPKAGREVENDIRLYRIFREEICEDNHPMMDANQWWDVDTAISYTQHLVLFNPWWIEEPTSADEVL